MDQNLKQIVRRHETLLSGNDHDFMTRVFADGVAKYRDRVAQYGMTGRRHVLDAGAGVGQWSLALATANRKVTALELSAQRVAFLQAVVDDLGLDNVEVAKESVSHMTCPDAAFDAVFCYGVLEQTPWKDVLGELHRVLSVGGLIYLNANGVGWYRFLWDAEHNRTVHYDPKAYAARAFINTVRYQRGEGVDFPAPLIIEPSEIQTEMRAMGFANIRIGGEGTLAAERYDGPRTAPFFRGQYKDDVCVYEVMARKAR